MLSNIQALEEYLNVLNKYKQQTISVVIDNKARILGITEKAAAIYDRSCSELLGEKVEKYTDQFDDMQKIIQKINLTKESVTILGVNYRRIRDYQTLILSYKPVINFDTGDVIAILISGARLEFPINWQKFCKLGQIDTRKSFILDKNCQDEFLTDLELEIIFLLFNCDTYEEIAQILSSYHNKVYNANYVGKIIRKKLMKKFLAYNLPMLKTNAIKLDYHKKIPVSLFGELILELDQL